jgi:hypothetical protein
MIIIFSLTMLILNVVFAVINRKNYVGLFNAFMAGVVFGQIIMKL